MFSQQGLSIPSKYVAVVKMVKMWIDWVWECCLTSENNTQRSLNQRAKREKDEDAKNRGTERIKKVNVTIKQNECPITNIWTFN